MGIVVNQSIKNTIVTYIGFAIGAVNALFMYPVFLGQTYYGLTGFILSSANIMMPLMAFGVHNTIIKFYSEYKTEEDQSKFLSFVLFLPLFMILPVLVIGSVFYEQLATALSSENPIIYDFVWQIPVIGLCMGYFEIFYAWAKVHMKSVFGNFVKEILLRVLISIFLFAVYLDLMTPVQFILATVLAYVMSTFSMAFFAFRIKRPKLSFAMPADKRSVLTYSAFIIMAGSVATLLLDIDKFMLGEYIHIDNIAYYSVAIFIATVISVPSRAMHQITYPITAKLMSESKYTDLDSLYKKTSLTLQIIGGYVLLGILVNINEVYKMLPAEYAGGIPVVFMIGLSKYFELMLGNNNAIIFNSKYYRTVLILGLALGIIAVGLNAYFIPLYGIDGAAIATLASIFVYTLTKLLFVIIKMKLMPFTRKTVHTILFSLLVFFSFYYWDFKYDPLVNILLKSALISVVYAYLVYKMRLSDDINSVMDIARGKFLRK